MAPSLYGTHNNIKNSIWKSMIFFTLLCRSQQEMAWKCTFTQIYFRSLFSLDLRVDWSENYFVGKIHPILSVSKGQLISKANSKLFIWTKKTEKISLYFCPSLKKWWNQEIKDKYIINSIELVFLVLLSFVSTTF